MRYGATRVEVSRDGRIHVAVTMVASSDHDGNAEKSTTAVRGSAAHSSAWRWRGAARAATATGSQVQGPREGRGLRRKRLPKGGTAARAEVPRK